MERKRKSSLVKFNYIKYFRDISFHSVLQSHTSKKILKMGRGRCSCYLGKHQHSLEQVRIESFPPLDEGRDEVVLQHLSSPVANHVEILCEAATDP
jgi:hypothetical protein